MVNKPKRTGTAFESLVRDYLRPDWPQVERRALAGGMDKGDLINVPFVVECKAVRAISLAEFVDETEQERENANEEFGICVIKRRNRNVKDAYAVVPLWMMVELLRIRDLKRSGKGLTKRTRNDTTARL